MKKILAIAPYSYLPYFSGGQKFIALFFEYLGRETDLTIVSVAENDFSLAKNYKTVSLLKKSFSRYLDPGLPSKIISLIHKEKYDYIIWEHPYYAWAAYKVKKQTGIKTIIHTHNIEHQRFRSLGKWWWRILKKYEHWFFKFADYIFFITQEDKEFTIKEWRIKPGKCIDVPFGIGIESYPKDRQLFQQAIREKYSIDSNASILLFNGLLNYKPNLDALMIILEKINPILLSQNLFKYKIIICGKGLPAELNELKDYASQNIIYAGFVENIDNYFKAADILLNPVESGGGIKTKMVEAIGFGATVVATKKGAIGINQSVGGEKLATINNQNWNEFASSIIAQATSTLETPASYYNYYYWGNIIKKMLDCLPNNFATKPVNN